MPRSIDYVRRGNQPMPVRMTYSQLALTIRAVQAELWQRESVLTPNEQEHDRELKALRMAVRRLQEGQSRCVRVMERARRHTHHEPLSRSERG